MKKINSRGLSLIEILVVLVIFSVLGIIISRSVILTLQGSKKSESLIQVRDNLNYSLGVIERQVRNANSVDCTSGNPTNLNYVDQYGNSSFFSCQGVGSADSYIASASGRLTSSDVTITSCSFTCVAATQTELPHVDINFAAQSSTLTGSQASNVTTSTRIYLRNY